jgi:MobA-like NTP transferase protein
MSEGPNGPTLVVMAAGRARRYGGCKPLAPVGPAGEAVIDLLASDAYAAGFTTIVMVLGTATGDAIRYHVEHRWPAAADVRFARQESPLGTVDAVLAAADVLTPGATFAVGNADDLFGVAALSMVATHLATGDPDNALVGFRLRNSIIGTSPVTRAICQVDGQGMLAAIEERRQVAAAGGGRFVAGDGRQPSELDGDDRVSMNLWAFGPAMWAAFRAAMDRARGAEGSSEVLLPDVVSEGVASRDGADPGDPSRFRVLPTEGRCIGVTNPDDLALVQADIARQVAHGDRPAQLWTAVA